MYFILGSIVSIVISIMELANMKHKCQSFLCDRRDSSECLAFVKYYHWRYKLFLSFTFLGIFLTVTFILFSFPYPLPIEGHLGIQHVREYDHGVNKI